MWRQRAKSFKLVDVDKNSKYFHSRATQRHQRNRILVIQNSMGKWVHHPKDIAESFTKFYQNLFASSNLTIREAAMNPLVKIVTDDMNAQLSQDFMEWEVQATLKQMASSKAPGPNCMPPLFYQNYWSLVGDDVTNTILSYLNTATICHPLNHTFLTLIPKIKNLVFVFDYRPICLCNVLYKKISKVLANRLKKILPSIINEQQRAFTKNCLISNNKNKKIVRFLFKKMQIKFFI